MSGSSAAVSLLNEAIRCGVISTELRSLVDLDGILSQENALVRSWSPYHSDLVIKRFNRLIHKPNNH